MSTGALPRSPELLLRNARIHPSVDAAPPAQSLAIDDGAVLAIGSDADLADVAGPATRVIDLDGRTVMPGFIDSHTHFHRTALVRRLFLDLEALAPRSIADVVELVRRRDAELPSGVWLQGDSLTAARLAEGRLPDRNDLDAAVPDRPVVLRGIGKHVVVANSAALAAAAIGPGTEDPPGGRIERDAAGQPTGILHERAKLRLDTSHPATVVPPIHRSERQAAVRAAVGDLHQAGITTIHEMVRLPEEADDLAELHASGDLPIRVRLYYRIHESPIRLEHLETLGIHRGLGDDHFRILGVKISVDGWCIFGNAAVYRPYCDEPDNRGLLRIEPDELREKTVAANRRGLQVALHAVGARAVDAALDAFEAAGPARGGPFRLEHAHLDIDDAQLRRMRALDVVWSVQPGFLGAYRADWEARLEPERVDRIMPIGRGGALGIPILHNSDVPSGPQDPLAAIRAAVTRDAAGRTIGAGECVSIEAAWRGWTTLPAWVAGERRIGRLVAGQAADLIVLARDPMLGTIDDLDRTVVATMIDGRFVYGADGVMG